MMAILSQLEQDPDWEPDNRDWRAIATMAQRGLVVREIQWDWNSDDRFVRIKPWVEITDAGREWLNKAQQTYGTGHPTTGRAMTREVLTDMARPRKERTVSDG